MNKTDKKNIIECAKCILRMRRELIVFYGDPNGWHDGRGQLQAYRDSLEAMKYKGLIKNYNLEHDTVEV